MCGRYCLETPRAELQLLLRSWLRPDDSAWLEHYAPRELIRPHEPSWLCGVSTVKTCLLYTSPSPRD